MFNIGSALVIHKIMSVCILCTFNDLCTSVTIILFMSLFVMGRERHLTKTAALLYLRLGTSQSSNILV